MTDEHRSSHVQRILEILGVKDTKAPVLAHEASAHMARVRRFRPWMSERELQQAVLSVPELGIVRLGKRGIRHVMWRGRVRNPSLPTYEEVKRDLRVAFGGRAPVRLLAQWYDGLCTWPRPLGQHRLAVQAHIEQLADIAGPLDMPDPDTVVVLSVFEQEALAGALWRCRNAVHYVAQGLGQAGIVRSHGKYTVYTWVSVGDLKARISKSARRPNVYAVLVVRPSNSRPRVKPRFNDPESEVLWGTREFSSSLQVERYLLLVGNTELQVRELQVAP